VTLSEAERQAVVHGRLVVREPAVAEATRGIRAAGETVGAGAGDVEAPSYVVLEAAGRVVAIATPKVGGLQPVVVLED
jgi:hypothetical protein